jgi:hypothetical protein
VAAAIGLRDGIGHCNDHLRIPAHDLASEVTIARVPPLGGIPLDDEVLSLHIRGPAQLLEKSPPTANSRVADIGDGTRGDDDRNPVLLCPFLRPPHACAACEQ